MTTAVIETSRRCCATVLTYVIDGKKVKRDIFRRLLSKFSARKVHRIVALSTSNMSVLNQNSDDEPQECPLCMEFLELDDINFYPCSCGYQVNIPIFFVLIFV